MEVSKSIKITLELVTDFAKVSRDFNTIHLDEEYAKNSTFGKPIAHGMLLSSFFSSLIAQEYPGPGSIYLNQELSFLRPCFIGETINVRVKLIKQEGAKYFLKTQIFNSRDEVIIDGQALILRKGKGVE